MTKPHPTDKGVKVHPKKEAVNNNIEGEVVGRQDIGRETALGENVYESPTKGQTRKNKRVVYSRKCLE